MGPTCQIRFFYFFLSFSLVKEHVSTSSSSHGHRHHAAPAQDTAATPPSPPRHTVVALIIASPNPTPGHNRAAPNPTPGRISRAPPQIHDEHLGSTPEPWRPPSTSDPRPAASRRTMVVGSTLDHGLRIRTKLFPQPRVHASSTSHQAISDEMAGHQAISDKRTGERSDSWRWAIAIEGDASSPLFEGRWGRYW
jgi:hypothetical protein